MSSNEYGTPGEDGENFTSICEWCQSEFVGPYSFCSKECHRASLIHYLNELEKYPTENAQSIINVKIALEKLN